MLSISSFAQKWPILNFDGYSLSQQNNVFIGVVWVLRPPTNTAEFDEKNRPTNAEEKTRIIAITFGHFRQ